MINVRVLQRAAGPRRIGGFAASAITAFLLNSAPDLRELHIWFDIVDRME